MAYTALHDWHPAQLSISAPITLLQISIRAIWLTEINKQNCPGPEGSSPRTKGFTVYTDPITWCGTEVEKFCLDVTYEHVFMAPLTCH